jgi:hypothetical protein
LCQLTSSADTCSQINQRFLNFVAKEAELKVGQLTCISTFATLDTDTWGGVTKTKQLLTSYKPD